VDARAVFHRENDARGALSLQVPSQPRGNRRGPWARPNAGNHRL